MGKDSITNILEAGPRPSSTGAGTRTSKSDRILWDFFLMNRPPVLSHIVLSCEPIFSSAFASGKRAIHEGFMPTGSRKMNRLAVTVKAMLCPKCMITFFALNALT